MGLIVDGTLCEDVGVFAYIEAGACFVGKFPVAVERGTGKFCVKFFEQRGERCFLRRGACVCGGLAIYSKPPDITDTDAPAVVIETMGARLFKRSAFVYGSIEIDHVVIADIPEAAGEVPAAYVSNGEGFAFRRC